jgi:hypothetical protein
VALEAAALDDWFGDIVEAPVYEAALGIAVAAELVAVDLGRSAAQADCASSRQYLAYVHHFLSLILLLHCSPVLGSFPLQVYHLVKILCLTGSNCTVLGTAVLRLAHRTSLSLDAAERLQEMNPMAKCQQGDLRVWMQNNP